ncbi:hypothetical protein [Limosilactobacillus reuteri]|uniref:hypothetical protein n=1 Tax=Limosilactobacillus reuteri TaxID=1598 RepID=UPI0013C30F0A|nr:hypothetical protein [Limosilactobacillus reuteri]
MNNKTRLLDKNRKASKKLKNLRCFFVWKFVKLLQAQLKKAIITVGKAIAISEIY